MTTTPRTSVGRMATRTGFQTSLRYHSKSVPRTTPPRNQTFRWSITRVSITRVCVSRDRLLISLLLAASRAISPGTRPQTTSHSDLHRPQHESRPPTPSREEQQNDDTLVYYPHLEQNYESPSSRLPKKERKGLRHLGQELLVFGLAVALTFIDSFTN
jgi:hypothetical protein